MIKKLKRHIFMYIQQFFNALEMRMLFHQRAETLQDYTLHSDIPGIVAESVVDGRQLIVSLTTYNKRLYEVYLTIESIMQQTVKPNKIILWLAEEMKDIVIPLNLQRQQKRGLEIRYTKDIRSYKKLIPTLKEYPEDVIITIDDDVIYEYDMIENLINSYKQAPGYVYANRVRRMTMENGEIGTYNTWKILDKYIDDSPLNIPTGVGGVLYPPHCFHDEVFNENVFMNICGRADDIWFKTMCILKGTQSRLAKTHSPVYYENESVQDIALYNTNVGNADNDKQTTAVFEKYQLYSKLK